MAQVLWNSDIDVYDTKIIPLSVASNICKFLDIDDILNFGLVSRNSYRAATDPKLWIGMLKDMDVWDTAVETDPSEPQKLDIQKLDDPVECLSSIVKIPRLARAQVLRIRSSLLELYRDLQSNISYDHLKVFQNYHSPEVQAKILLNLQRFNAIDVKEASRTTVKEKLSDLVEIFENALLRELEIHFDLQDYSKCREFVEILITLNTHLTLIDFFLQKTCFDNETVKFLSHETFSVESFFQTAVDPLIPLASESSPNEDLDSVDHLNGAHLNGVHLNGVEDTEDPQSTPSFIINPQGMDEFTTELATVFNDLSATIDKIFPQSIPMMFRIAEELLTNQLQEVFLVLTSTAKEKGLYLEIVPYIYKQLSLKFLNSLKPSENVGEAYLAILHDLLDVSFESYTSEYMNEEKMALQHFCAEEIRKWKIQEEQKEAEKTQKILKHVKVESKSDFLSNFKKVFTISAGSDTPQSTVVSDPSLNFSEIQANARILAENIKALDKVFSPDLALKILKESKESFVRLLNFQHFTINSVVAQMYSAMQEEFIGVIDTLGAEHLKIGFERSLKYLKEYDPNEINELISPNAGGSSISSLVIFFELINRADTIVQMIDIYYKEEIINKNVVKHENSVLNPSLQSKRALEGMVDKYVADGLNIGIDVLFREVDSAFLTLLKDSDYNPAKMSYDGPTVAGQKVVLILEDNIDLLGDSADKSIVEVFQQEVAERFFQAIVKLIKLRSVSEVGAVNLISDLNLYYKFILGHIKSNKRMVFPLFEALKKVGTIYLISGSDSKAIGQLVSDLSKFNGIFSQEEIYEFVQRRLDWTVIKRHVEKVMYGLSLGDCSVM